MQGYDVELARALLRVQLTREWELEHPEQALTAERLVLYAMASAGGNRSVRIRTALAIRQLGAMGISHAQMAQALGIDVEEVRYHRDRQLVDNTGAAAMIEAEVLAAVGETPEPERYVAPVDAQGEHVARIDAKARLIEHEIGR